MAKQGMHENDRNDQRKSRGHNQPSKSMTITAGTPKKKETYRKQAFDHKNPAKLPQAAKNEWKPDTHEPTENEIYSRVRRGPTKRSGSDSNTDSGTRGH